MRPATNNCINPGDPDFRSEKIEGIEGLTVTLEAELREGILRYLESADGILNGSGVRLSAPAAEYFSLERNFFSALFLYSYMRAGIPPERRILYVAVNQCLRGIVTGCDNLLDDEYKITLDTDLPATGIRFRSVMDIMVSDRVLFELLLDHGYPGGFSPERIRQAAAVSLRALARSGAQEASEEGGVAEDRLHPEKVLSEVHHYKTGLLFQCAWAVPSILENGRTETADLMKDALYRIGIGCQVMDDMVDLIADLRNHRHNFVASLVHHGNSAYTREDLRAASTASTPPARFYSEHPDLLHQAHAVASGYLRDGLTLLFSDRCRYLVEWAASSIGDRIGVNRLIAESDGEGSH